MAWLSDGQPKARQLPVPLFKLLAEREEGSLGSLALERAVRAVRAEQLGLSQNRDIPAVSDSVVTCMRIDEVENRYLLSGRNDGRITIVDVEDRPNRSHINFEEVVQINRSPSNHQFAVTGVAWYPVDTGMFVSSSFDKTVKLWDTNKAKPAHGFNLPDKVLCIDMLSSTTRHLMIAAGCSDHRIYLCDVRTSTQSHTLRGHSGPVQAVSWRPGVDFTLVSGSKDGTLRLWDIRRTKSSLAILSPEHGPRLSRKRERDHEDVDGLSPPVAHAGGVEGVMHTPDGMFLLSSGADSRMRLWNPDTCEMVVVNYGTFQHRRSGTLRLVHMAYSWNARIVYHPRGTDVVGCNLQTGERVSVLRGHLDSVTCLAVQNGSEQVFSAGHDGHILVWAPPSAYTQADADEDAARPPEDNWSDSD